MENPGRYRPGSLSGSLRLGKPNRTAGHRGMGDHAYQLNTERQGCRGDGVPNG